MSLEIVSAQSCHVPGLVRLNGLVQAVHARLYPAIFRADWDACALEKLWRERIVDRDAIILVAVRDHHLVGYLWCNVQYRLPDALQWGHRRLHVHHIAVDDQARGSGVGTMLLDQAEARARHLGAAQITLAAWVRNACAQEFFRSRGYEGVTTSFSKLLEPVIN